MVAFVHLFVSVHGSVCLCELFSRGSAGLCWHAAARYFQGEQLRKCPWHVLCIVQYALPRLAQPAVTNNHRLQSPLHPSHLLHTHKPAIPTNLYEEPWHQTNSHVLFYIVALCCFARCILSSSPSLEPLWIYFNAAACKPAIHPSPSRSPQQPPFSCFES